jgi:hypothetical protein
MVEIITILMPDLNLKAAFKNSLELLKHWDCAKSV